MMKASTIVDKPQARLPGAVRFADESAAALLADHLDVLFDPVGHGWERIKRNASRTVCRGWVGAEQVYVKQYHPSPPRRVLRLVGICDSLYEMAFGQYLRAHGVETFRPLAAHCSASTEWLATEAVAPTRSAEVWHEEQLGCGRPGQRRIRQALLALAELVGRMHLAGAIHRDLHCGNVLIRTDGERVQPVLMDLHRAVRRRRLSRRAMAANLAQLYHDRALLTTRTQRLRFLRQYLATTGAEGTLRGWQIQIERFAGRHTRRQHAQRDRRIAGRNRYFKGIRLRGGWSGHVVLASKRRMAGSRAAHMEFTAEQWREALSDPDALLRGQGAEVIKDSPSALVVRRRLRVGPHELDVIIKKPRRKRRWKLLVDCFRPARPTRAFVKGHTLLTRRIATALPLVALERRVGPVLLDSMLITEAVDGLRLNEFFDTWLARPPKADPNFTIPQQRQLAQEALWQLGRLVQSLHDNNFAHRDLKATNILVRWTNGRRPEVVLVDMDGLRRMRRITQRRRLQGLMRLNVSLLNCPVVNHAGRLRMLLGYLRRPGSGRIHFKPYWRVLERWSSKKLRQQIRSRRRRQKAVRRPAW